MVQLIPMFEDEQLLDERLAEIRSLRTEVSRLEAENLRLKKLIRDVNSYVAWYIEANTPMTIYTYWKEALNV